MPQRASFDSGFTCAENLVVLDEIRGERPSAAKAGFDSVGFMRGLSPPPPSGSSFSQPVKPPVDFAAITARLRLCPDTVCSLNGILHETLQSRKSATARRENLYTEGENGVWMMQNRQRREWILVAAIAIGVAVLCLVALHASSADAGVSAAILPLLFVGIISPLSLLSPMVCVYAGRTPDAPALPTLFQRPPPFSRA